jgi:NDP-sugar pyrophosphorylase family protein
LTLPVAILAGGLGTRLGELSKNKPKALAEVAGAPFIHHQLRLLRDKGVDRVVILAGYKGEMIRESVGDGAAFGLKADYSFDWPELLGTGGALAKALDLLPELFLVLYGDSYLEIDYQAAGKAFLDSGQPAMMTVWRNEGALDQSNVLFEEGVVKLYDKAKPLPSMRHIDYGLGGLSAQALAGRPKAFDLAEVYSDLSRQGLLAGLEVHERFYEIGSLAGLNELDAYLRANKVL